MQENGYAWLVLSSAKTNQKLLLVHYVEKDFSLSDRVSRQYEFNQTVVYVSSEFHIPVISSD
jgi:hypothetical protein